LNKGYVKGYIDSAPSITFTICWKKFRCHLRDIKTHIVTMFLLQTEDFSTCRLTSIGVDNIAMPIGSALRTFDLSSVNAFVL